MNRTSTAPGGPGTSHVKRQRVAELKSLYATDPIAQPAPEAPAVPAPTPTSRPSPRKRQHAPAATAATAAAAAKAPAASRLQQGGASTLPAAGGGFAPQSSSSTGRQVAAAVQQDVGSSGQQAGAVSRLFPYAALDQSIKDGQLASYLRGIDTGFDAGPAPASISSGPSWSRAGPGLARDPGYTGRFVEAVLATNTTQSADNLAACAQKMLDRTMALDNPVKNVNLGEQAGIVRQRVGYCTRLVKRVKERGSVVSRLKVKGRKAQGKSTVSYASLLQLHSLWQDYLTDILPDTQQPGTPGTVKPAKTTAQSAAAAGAMIGFTEERLLNHVDMHGCKLRVVHARDARHVGVSGILAAVTKKHMSVVDEQDRLHVLPAKGSVVQYEAPGGRKVTLHLGR